MVLCLNGYLGVWVRNTPAGVLRRFARELGVSTDENDQGLFVLDPGLRRESLPVSGVPVDKTFRPFAPNQNFLLPPSLDEWLPTDHMARFIADLVDEHLDLSRIHVAYMKEKGGPPYDLRLMVRLLIFGYATGSVRHANSRPRVLMWPRSGGWPAGWHRISGRLPGSANDTSQR